MTNMAQPCHKKYIFLLFNRDRFYHFPTFCWFDNLIFYPLGLEKESLRAQKNVDAI